MDKTMAVMADKLDYGEISLRDYENFLKSKLLTVADAGFEIDPAALHPRPRDFQRDVIAWSLKKGRAGIFGDVGTGKSTMQGEWTRHAVLHTGMPGLIVSELAVCHQMIDELALLDMEVRYITSQAEVDLSQTLFYVTNYERLDAIDPTQWGSVSLDESSILKSFDGVTRGKLIEMFAQTPYRLVNSATPCPNDPTEIGAQAEFLGVMTHVEMLATFFTYDSDQQGANAYRLKNHARKNFYQWLASWCVAFEKPSDLGPYDDTHYIKPPLLTEIIVVNADYTPKGYLPGIGASGSISATDAKKIRRFTIHQRAEKAAAMINADTDQWVVWTALNEEADTLAETIPDAVNVHGSLSPEEKARLIKAFVKGEIRVLITKTKIAGKGINMQRCHKMMHFGIDYSWEAAYQAVGRIHRSGQKAPAVYLYVLTSQQERSIWDVVEKKGREAKMMTQELIAASRTFMAENLAGVRAAEFTYAKEDTVSTSGKWRMLMGDSAERMKELPDESVDISIYSPPFPEIFVYSNTERDLGNSRTMDEFFEHYAYMIRENYRVMKPGRLVGVHCMDTRMLKGIDGVVGRKDFSGLLIEAYRKAGFIFTQRITIDKNPQAQAIRMKAHGLLFKTLKKDSTDLTGGYADYLLVFRKPGQNAVPVTPIENGDMTTEDWIRDAHPVWYDIEESDTLNTAQARSEDDTKHLCPLQLPLIRRFVRLYSNPGELVLSMFGGIGSEGVAALECRRRFLGIELKPEYYATALRMLRDAETRFGGRTLFDLMADTPAVRQIDTTKVWVCDECRSESTHELEHTPCDVCGWMSDDAGKQKPLDDMEPAS